jgi:hypothetical protein
MEWTIKKAKSGLVYEAPLFYIGARQVRPVVVLHYMLRSRCLGSRTAPKSVVPHNLSPHSAIWQKFAPDERLVLLGNSGQ